MELTPTGTVILGFLSESEMSGYDIKTQVDKSTRFFWTASYGQIYPELKRLNEVGLIEEAGGPTGERRRTAYRINERGRREFEAWLLSPNDTLEMRHEGLLKVFFADSVDRQHRNDLVRGIAGQHREKLNQLLAVSAGIEASGQEEDELSCDLVLRFGIEFQEWIIGWCEREIERNEA